jgi:hypothetical protein
MNQARQIERPEDMNILGPFSEVLKIASVSLLWYPLNRLTAVFQNQYP